ncbi:MAG: AraC family transcriptional regulator [Pseudomonadota bacterium]
MTQAVFAELLLRGAAGSLLLLMGVRLSRPGQGFVLPNLAATFALTTCAYTILSASANELIDVRLLSVLAVIGTLNSVFFWWFATALFDDSFRWNSWRFVPALILLVFYALRRSDSTLIGVRYDEFVQQCVVIAMMLHAIALALINYRIDLVEPRRKFRLAFAVLVGLTGLIISVIEIILAGHTVPQYLSLLHAAVIFTLSFGFSFFVLGSSAQDMFQFETPDRVALPVEPEALAIPSKLLVRLEELMKEGTYREEGLTIAILAAKIGLPEYRLRRLINQQLGFKNFNAYLNSYRVAEAQRILGDPHQVRRQVTLIALDLGYGSIATFNRAFKQATGQTPSSFRKSALASPTLLDGNTD